LGATTGLVVMITPSFGLTATERVLPRLALDFTTASLDPRVTFTRSGNTATVTNSSGYVAPINADLPRFDFDPITLACKGLLIEESRVNSYTYSQDFTNVIWTKDNASITPNAAVSPSNTNDAGKLVENGGLSVHRLITTAISLIAGSSYTYTIYAKAAGRSAIQFLFSNPAVDVNFDLSNGTVSRNNGTTASIVNVGNGWYRCVATITAATTTSSSSLIYLCNTPTMARNGSYQGDGTSGVFFWGAQLEAGAFATSYIPTTTTALTRNADVATMTGTNFSDWFNASEGAFFIEATNFYPPKYQPILRIDNGVINDSIYFDIDSSTARMVAFVNNVNQCVIGTSTLTANTKFKIVGAYKLDSYAASLNAGSVGTDNSATVPTVNRLLLGNDGVNIFNGHYAKVNYYPQRLINAEVQAFSK